jgi:hypothetical protein
MRKGLILVAIFALCPILLAQGLDNNAIIKLAKAGMSDDVIVSTVNASQGNFDTSANGLIALKNAGVSDRVISALVLKASGATPAAAQVAATSASALPPGIDDVGVYYMDKSGKWAPLMPEIVNFKTGGVMKSFATGGMVKGDINGHLQGGHAKVVVTFPATIAVYVPEGTAITEYQLLRFRTGGNSREFRSVTGGVMHVSGGASRDLVESSPEKIAPRVYQIKLDSSLGKGEYGLLPPGSYGSSNMGSNGKIYSISIAE